MLFSLDRKAAPRLLVRPAPVNPDSPDDSEGNTERSSEATTATAHPREPPRTGPLGPPLALPALTLQLTILAQPDLEEREARGEHESERDQNERQQLPGPAADEHRAEDPARHERCRTADPMIRARLLTAATEPGRADS